jgi:hypothetical protein
VCQRTPSNTPVAALRIPLLRAPPTVASVRSPFRANSRRPLPRCPPRSQASSALKAVARGQRRDWLCRIAPRCNPVLAEAACRHEAAQSPATVCPRNILLCQAPYRNCWPKPRGDSWCGCIDCRGAVVGVGGSRGATSPAPLGHPLRRGTVIGDQLSVISWQLAIGGGRGRV